MFPKAVTGNSKTAHNIQEDAYPNILPQRCFFHLKLMETLLRSHNYTEMLRVTRVSC